MNTITSKPSADWLNVRDASHRSGWDIQWVRTLIRNGQMVAVKRYGKWEINAHSLQNLMQERGRDV